MTRQRNVSLNYRPRPWQEDCHRKAQRFSVRAVHRRGGKTHLAIMELVDKAMQFKGELGNFIYLAPLLKQAHNIAWGKLKHITKPLLMAGMIEVREGNLEIAFKSNGARIRLFGANNPEEIRGEGIDGVVVDEVAQIEPYVWEEIVQPALSDRLGWALFIGTPNGINLFSKLFFYAQQTPGWHAAKFTVYDTDALDPAEVERLRTTMTPNAFAREYLCDFSASAEEQVLGLNDIEESVKRQYRMVDIAEAPRILGVDPARMGDDRSVIMRRQGLVAFNPIVLTGINNMELASRVAVEIDGWKPDAVFIDQGAGAGVIDRLRQLGHAVMEIPFGGSAIQKDRYFNRRTEMWFAMADWVRAGGKIPDIHELKQELATPTYWFINDQKRMESKDDSKKRLKYSPDIADALALTFAAPVQSAMDREHTMIFGSSAPRVRYDPYGKEAMARRRIGR